VVVAGGVEVVRLVRRRAVVGVVVRLERGVAVMRIMLTMLNLLGLKGHAVVVAVLHVVVHGSVFVSRWVSKWVGGWVGGNLK
jgi:fatty acid desaturase